MKKRLWQTMLGLLALWWLVSAATPAWASQANPQAALVKFVSQKLTGKYGIYTNYLAQAGSDEHVATGHQYLSESAGYYLQYLAQTKQNRKFRAFYAQTKRTFYRQQVFLYRFDPKQPGKYRVNATIDDLRIIAALMTYDQRNHTTKYQKEIKTLYQGLRRQVQQDGLLTDMYSLTERTHNQEVTLCYQNLAVLKKLDPQSYRQALCVVQGGRIGAHGPLYYQSYRLNMKKYAQSQLVTPQLLITFLHLAEVGKLPPASLHWLKQQVTKQTLYNAYTTTGRVKDRNTSAANYALAMLIGQEVGDQALTNTAKQALLAMQVTDANSAIYGSFGDPQTKQVYSFNELTALVALNQS